MWTSLQRGVAAVSSDEGGEGEYIGAVGRAAKREGMSHIDRRMNGTGRNMIGKKHSNMTQTAKESTDDREKRN